MKLKSIKLKFIILMAVLCPTLAIAQTFTVGDFTYKVISTKNKTVRAVKYIPTTYNGAEVGRPVTYSGEEYNVTEIGRGCFDNASNLEYISINYGTVTTLQTECIRNCQNLKFLTLNPYIDPELIGFPFYSNCPNLERFICNGSNVVGGKLNAGYASIDGTVHNTEELYTITGDIVAYPPAKKDEIFILQGKCKKIYPYAFYDHKYLKNVTASKGHGPKEICDHAFEKSSITSYKAGFNLERLGNNAFAKSQLEEFEFMGWEYNSPLETIGDSCFYSTHLTRVTLPRNPNGITICESAFESNSSLYEVQLATTKNIRHRAFRRCGNLSKISFPSTLESIMAYAFQYCTSLRDLDFTNCTEMQTIDDLAFADCYTNDKTQGRIRLKDGKLPPNLTGLGVRVFQGSKLGSTNNTIHIPASIWHMGYNPFIGNWGIEEFTVDEGNKYFTAIDGVLFQKATVEGDVGIKRLICYPSKSTGVGAPNTPIIPHWAKMGYVIPSSVNTIDPGAFENCRTLRHVVLPSDITYIPPRLFANSSIEAITIPAKVNYIYQGAFANCTELKEVYAMPETPATLARGETEAIIDYDAASPFGNISDCTLYTKYGESILKAYQENAEYNKAFKTITRDIPLTIGASGYVTLGRDFDVYLRPSTNKSLKLYFASAFDADKAEVTLSPLKTQLSSDSDTKNQSYIPSRVYNEENYLNDIYNGVIVKGTPGKTYYVYMGLTDYNYNGDTWIAEDGQTNMMKTTLVETEMEPTNGDYTRFVLKDGKFRRVTTAGISSYAKAYLELPTAEIEKLYGSDALGKGLNVVFEDEDNETTFVDGITTETPTVNNDIYYTLSGVRVSKPTRGIYIKNGKKVIIK